MTEFGTSDLFCSSKHEPVYPCACCTSSHGDSLASSHAPNPKAQLIFPQSKLFLPILSRVILDFFSHTLHIHLLSSPVDSMCKYPLIHVLRSLVLSLCISLCLSVCVSHPIPNNHSHTRYGDEHLSSQPLESRSRRNIESLSLVYTVNLRPVVQNDYRMTLSRKDKNKTKKTATLYVS